MRRRLHGRRHCRDRRQSGRGTDHQGPRHRQCGQRRRPCLPGSQSRGLDHRWLCAASAQLCHASVVRPACPAGACGQGSQPARHCAGRRRDRAPARAGAGAQRRAGALRTDQRRSAQHGDLARRAARRRRADTRQGAARARPQARGRRAQARRRRTQTRGGGRPRGLYRHDQPGRARSGRRTRLPGIGHLQGQGRDRRRRSALRRHLHRRSGRTADGETGGPDHPGRHGPGGTDPAALGLRHCGARDHAGTPSGALRQSGALALRRT